TALQYMSMIAASGLPPELVEPAEVPVVDVLPVLALQAMTKDSSAANHAAQVKMRMSNPFSVMLSVGHPQTAGRMCIIIDRIVARRVAHRYRIRRSATAGLVHRRCGLLAPERGAYGHDAGALRADRRVHGHLDECRRAWVIAPAAVVRVYLHGCR